MKAIGIFVVIGWIIRIVVLLVIVFMGFGAIAFITGNDSEPPPPDKAQYAIQTYSMDGTKTPSRVYFTDEIIFDGSLPVVYTYWTYDGEKYKEVKGERVFTEPVTIVRRVR